MPRGLHCGLHALPHRCAAQLIAKAEAVFFENENEIRLEIYHTTEIANLYLDAARACIYFGCASQLPVLGGGLTRISHKG